MSEGQLNIGVIGLGVMGQRMLARLATHPRLRATTVWDAQPAAIAATLQAYPELRAADSAEALIASPGLHSLYIATPPAPHMALSELAFDAGLAVFCEKPLTVAFDAARACIARIEAQGQRAAVNFALASSKGLALLQSQFGKGTERPLGDLQSIELELAFAAWPRPWQAAAGAWLGERIEGGFSREVLSHFIFALQRVLAPAQVHSSRVQYPADGISAEIGLQAELQAAGVPLSIRGSVGGAGEVPADLNRMRWQAAAGQIQLQEWFSQIEVRTAAGHLLPQEVSNGDLRLNGQRDQLDQWVALIEGRPHGLPGYAEALAVQETIEALLQGRG
ncbi:Gfo/Idh/MocA family protein [Paucibacter sp. Y2R2-4]|uniref:Gfo/Idh/MocA family protein n=1 Tax=Paucibacter sp. Y2R2-4 TaxID=2893553 RepID=UPI0021E35D66|nr:Gfo/Idh/MocA family oxidoreductase [Paucibacter sp. Y2R2-4]MCV2349957.1 Gfo/Idh/MocA family oxidoreductase [Paucibacter sp. Y2R2-4]